jgi:hypothetical protein
MRYVKKYLAKKVFVKFEGWSDSTDIAEKDDH